MSKATNKMIALETFNTRLRGKYSLSIFFFFLSHSNYPTFLIFHKISWTFLENHKFTDDFKQLKFSSLTAETLSFFT